VKLNKVAIVFSLIAILFFGTISGTASAIQNEHANENSSHASIIPGNYIVVLHDEFSPSDVAKNHGLSPKFVYKNALNGFAGHIPEPILAKLQEDSRVKFVEQEQIYHTMEHHTPIEPQILPTGLDRIDVELNPTANIDNVNDVLNARVAIIDTGVDLANPDLNIDYNSAADCTYSNLFQKICYYGPGNGHDGHGHGTHVAGTVGAKDNDIGVVGVAPGATIIPVRVLDNNGSGSTSGVIAGIEYVTWTITNGIFGDEIDVANMSLGGPSSLSIQIAVTNSINAGVFYAVAAGNAGDDAANTSPANTLLAMTVSAIADFDGLPGGLSSSTCRSDQDDTFADFSNYGEFVDIAAPGVCIESLMPSDICLSSNGYCQNGLDTISGTSMATPHVAGAAALEIANDSDLTPSQITSNLLNKAIPQNSPFGFTEDPDMYKEPLLYLGDNSNLNLPPSVNAGLDQTVSDVDGNGWESITLSGSASDDGTIQSYEWSENGTPLGTFASLTDNFAVGTHTFSLMATDDDGASSSDSLIVTINANSAPVAIADGPASVNSGDSVNLDGLASYDPDNGPITYSWIQTGGDAVDLSDSTIADPTFSTIGIVGDLTFELEVTDIGNLSDVDSITVTTIDVSSPTDTVHVGDLEYNASNKKNWKGDVWITVHNQGDIIVEGATVNGYWFNESNTQIGSSSCLTDSTGTCQVSKTTRESSMTFSVTGIVKDGFPYVGPNHDIDSDSDGTTITLTKGENSGGTGDGGGEDPGNDSPTEAECQAIVDQYNQKDASGKKIPPKLQSNYNECIFLYEHLAS
jgi:hypothetical protein